MAELLAAKPGFAAGVTVDQAGDIIYAVLSEDAYRLFCIDRGWEHGQWQAWCLTSLRTALADPPGAAAGSRLDARHDAV